MVRRSSRTALAVLSFALLLSVAPSADADQFFAPFPCGAACTAGAGTKPDDWVESYCWGSTFTSPDLRQGVQTAMDKLDAQTSYGDVYLATCDSGTNIRFMQDTLAGGTYGVWGCDAPLNPDGECVRSVITLDLGDLASKSLQGKAQAALHEIGHAVGLGHYSGDAMESPTDPNGSLFFYSSHHVAHIQQSHDSPVGSLDAITDPPGYGGIRFQGWTLDPDVLTTPYPLLQVRVDATLFWQNMPQPNQYRSDLATTFISWGGSHGYDFTLGIGPGGHWVTLYWLNSAYGGATVTLGPYYVNII